MLPDLWLKSIGRPDAVAVPEVLAFEDLALEDLAPEDLAPDELALRSLA